MIEYTVKVDDYGITQWLLNDELHREDGPAVEWPNGDLCWCINGVVHRDDGPAMEWNTGDVWWYKNGRLHRDDGPAIEGPECDAKWYLNGEQLTEKEFNIRTKVKELTMSELTELVGYQIKIIK